MAVTTSSSSASVRTLERGISILNCFAEDPALTMSEIAEQTGLSTSTVSRILRTLEDQSYLVRDEYRRFSLGPQLRQLGRVALSNRGLRQVAIPVLEHLRNLYGETASLYVIQGDSRVCIESRESLQALKRSVPVGEVRPLTQGAVGTVLLAWLPMADRERLRSADDLENEESFAAIRQAGYVENDSVHEPDVYAIAAPVLDARGQVAAALSVSGPSHRIGPELRKELRASMTSHAQRITDELTRTQLGDSGRNNH